MKESVFSGIMILTNLKPALSAVDSAGMSLSGNILQFNF